MGEIYPGNMEVSSVSSISVQSQERYTARAAIDMRCTSTIIPNIMVALQIFHLNTSVQMVHGLVSNK